MFTCVRGSLEGVQLGAVMVVMMIGGGNSTPCIWQERKMRGRERVKVRIIEVRALHHCQNS